MSMHPYVSRWIVLVIALVVVAGDLAASPEPVISVLPKDGVDLLTLNKGIAKSGKLRAENIDRSTDNEFLDYQRAFVKKDGRVIFTIPAEDSPEKYRYVGFGPLPVQPLHRYSLIMESANLATNFINLASITFLKGDTRTHFNGVQYKARSDFGTPPDADRIVVWLGVSAWPNKLTPGPKVEFKSLKVVDRGPLNGTPGLAERPGENLLPVSDFENEPVGEFVNRNYFYPGNGTNVKSGKNIFAEIVADGSNKCLHIVKGKEGYIYPFLKTRTMNLNNCTLVFTCRMKGKGKIQPHIWWWLKGVKGTAWSYYGEGSYDLTGTWQTVRTWRSCVNDSDYAACALAIQSPEADFYVDDLSLTIIPHAVD